MFGFGHKEQKLPKGVINNTGIWLSENTIKVITDVLGLIPHKTRADRLSDQYKVSFEVLEEISKKSGVSFKGDLAVVFKTSDSVSFEVGISLVDKNGVEIDFPIDNPLRCVAIMSPKENPEIKVAFFMLDNKLNLEGAIEGAIR